jgi:hypothetical protein
MIPGCQDCGELLDPNLLSWRKRTGNLRLLRSDKLESKYCYLCGKELTPSNEINTRVTLPMTPKIDRQRRETKDGQRGKNFIAIAAEKLLSSRQPFEIANTVIFAEEDYVRELGKELGNDSLILPMTGWKAVFDISRFSNVKKFMAESCPSSFAPFDSCNVTISP